MKVFVLSLALLGLGVATAAAPAMKELSFIDQYTLRRMWKFTPQEHAVQVAEIKRNMDFAKAYGMTAYVLFMRSFEGFVNYDFSDPTLGDLTNRVWSADSPKRQEYQIWSQSLNDVLDYGEKIGIKVLVHTNQFDYPDTVFELAGDKMAGSAKVCPGKDTGFTLLEGKLLEFFRNFPKAAGVQVSVSESAINLNECRCPACENLSPDQRFQKMGVALAKVQRQTDKEIILRTWGRFETSEAVKALPAEIVCGTKVTLPDFHLINAPNPVMGLHGSQQEIELDAFGEYSGWNWFPCYWGDAFAERIRLCSDKGVTRLGIRLNLEPRVRYIFDTPYGNQVNISLFSELGKNPYADPDQLLRNYISQHFPQSARDAAFQLYKKSFGWQHTWLTYNGVNCNDHSRVYKGGVGRVRSQLGWVVPKPFTKAKAQLDDRRANIDQAYKDAIAAVDALGVGVPAEWIANLKAAARTQWFVAQGNTDTLELFAAHNEKTATGTLPDLSSLKETLFRRVSLWEKTDPENFEILYGSAPAEMWQEVAGADDAR